MIFLNYTLLLVARINDIPNEQISKVTIEVKVNDLK